MKKTSENENRALGPCFHQRLRNQRVLPAMATWCLVVTAAVTAVSDEPLRALQSNLIEDQIRAQAALLEQNRKLQDELVEARNRYVEAAESLKRSDKGRGDRGDQLRESLDNVNTYLEMKRSYHQYQWQKLEFELENLRRPLVRDQMRVLNLWDRTMADPESKRFAIRSGRILNFMLQQLQSKSGLGSASEVSEVIAKDLSKFGFFTLNALTVQVSGPGGPVSVSLTEPLPPLFRRCPYLFRDPELIPLRDEVLATAEKLYAPGLSDDQKFLIGQQLERNIAALSAAFFKKYPANQRKGLSSLQWGRINDAEQFLENALQTGARHASSLSEFAASQPVYTSVYPADQRNVATLCQFMIRNGVEFGKAKQGAEPIYHQLFSDICSLAEKLGAAPSKEDVEDAMVNLHLEDIISDRK